MRFPINQILPGAQSSVFNLPHHIVRPLLASPHVFPRPPVLRFSCQVASVTWIHGLLSISNTMCSSGPLFTVYFHTVSALFQLLKMLLAFLAAQAKAMKRMAWETSSRTKMDRAASGSHSRQTQLQFCKRTGKIDEIGLLTNFCTELVIWALIIAGCAVYFGESARTVIQWCSSFNFLSKVMT